MNYRKPEQLTGLARDLWVLDWHAAEWRLRGATYAELQEAANQFPAPKPFVSRINTLTLLQGCARRVDRELRRRASNVK